MTAFKSNGFFAYLFCVGFFIFSATIYAENRSKKNTDSYTEVKVENLKIEPEEFKRKDIFFLTRFNGFRTGFHGYMERSGFTNEKYYWLGVAPYNLPVLAKKKDFDDMASLKNGMKLKLYGEIKKFTVVPYFKEAPRYYLDLEKLEIVTEEKEVQKPVAKTEEVASGTKEKKLPAQSQSGKCLPVPKLK
ncbi:MAG: hypothetical protein A2017_12770 [Lentisphaerae bacterium GWF2_44_16]|nr:MAG: hypothetical protein A2017_12770 [Lentisphaerae bacterium GWF2_44_16]